MYLILNNDICSLFVPQSVSMATGNLCATADTPEEIADTFNNYFTSVLSVPQEDKVDSSTGKFPAARRTPL